MPKQSGTTFRGIHFFNQKRQTGKTTTCFLYAKHHKRYEVFLVVHTLFRRESTRKSARKFFNGNVPKNLHIITVEEYIRFMKGHKYLGVKIERGECKILFDDAQEVIPELLKQINAWCDYCFMTLPEEESPFDKSNWI